MRITQIIPRSKLKYCSGEKRVRSDKDKNEKAASSCFFLFIFNSDFFVKNVQ